MSATLLGRATSTASVLALIASVSACVEPGGADADGAGGAPGTGSASSVCLAGQELCGSSCVQLASNWAHCGSCGNACGSAQVCANGACAATCPAELTQCGSSCVDPQSDPANCGTCSAACDPGQLCVAGACSGGSASGTGGTGGTGGASWEGTAGSAAVGTGGSSGAAGGSPAGGASTGGAATGGAPANPDYPQCFAGDAMPLNPTLTVDPDVTGYTTAISNDSYVVMLIGPDRPECITDQIAERNLADLDRGLREVVELVGFPAFPEWANGHYLNWVILNSGIPGATLPQEGGHQGDRWGHMNFESTETCPCVWDDYQSGGALHECVHALQAELWVYNNPASGWAHEAHNNYLTTQANAMARDEYTMGWAASLVLQMPHVPIESMGLFDDGVVAGPSDQLAGDHTYVSTQVRYGLEIFFLSMSQTTGRGFLNCLWMEPESGNRRGIFQVLQDLGGDDASGQILMDFAAKTAILDFEGWTETVRRMLRGGWEDNYWFYTFPDGDGTTTFRPPTANVPHHQGRNVIPIQLDPGATSVTVEFTPDAAGSLGTPASMAAQLVYRDSSDQPVYGEVFTSGQSTIEVPGGARGDIVNLAVAVTTPNAPSGSDDGSNKGFDGQEHFDYQARIVSGGTIAPTSTRPW